MINVNESREAYINIHIKTLKDNKSGILNK